MGTFRSLLSKTLRVLAPLLAAALCSMIAPSCGAMRFHHAWTHQGVPADEPLSLVPIRGRWKGTWRSHWNGHSGGLRCIVTPAEPGRVGAWFYSTYGYLLFFQYRTPLAVFLQDDGCLRFEGEEDLGSLAGGVYRYRGFVKGDLFRASYRAANGDHGVFEMERVDPRPEE